MIQGNNVLPKVCKCLHDYLRLIDATTLALFKPIYPPVQQLIMDSFKSTGINQIVKLFMMNVTAYWRKGKGGQKFVIDFFDPPHRGATKKSEFNVHFF